MAQKNLTEDKVVDFSKFPKRTTTPVSTAPVNQFWSIKKKVVYIALFILLVVAQVTIFIWLNQSTKPASLPEGYKLVSPSNQPAYLEKIK